MDAELAAVRAELVRVDADGAGREQALKRQLDEVRSRNAAVAARCDQLEGQLRQLRQR